MVFKSYQPSPILKPFVQCYLETDNHNNKQPGAYTLFPNGLSGIFFNFGRGHLLIKEKHKVPPVSIFGQIDRHFTATHKPGFYSLGVLMKPTALGHLLREDMAQFTNTITDGTLLISDIQSLHNQLANASGIRGKIRLLETYFAKLLPTARPTLATEVLTWLEQPHTVSVEKIAERLKVSQRHLETQFKHQIGLSPKTYAIIMRFKRMEHLLRSQTSVNWQKMTFASEYHDQNHFIKDFKRFTGQTPGSYLLKNFEMGQSYFGA